MEVGAICTRVRASPGCFSVHVPQSREREWKGVLTILCHVTHVKGLRVPTSLNLSFNCPWPALALSWSQLTLVFIRHGGNVSCCFQQLLTEVTPVDSYSQDVATQTQNRGLAEQCDLEQGQQLHSGAVRTQEMLSQSPGHISSQPGCL